MKHAVIALLLVLAGCAAPPPAAPAGPAAPASPLAPDRSCRSDADCVVKNVGNCCGAMPACVNKDSPTDPQGVQAQCAASGRMSVCGFADVTACQCVSGRCESDSSSSTLPAR